MQRVITINLNGNAYQIDEGGYTALVAYLEGAGRQLADNPDRAEIVADLEQAIADKCRGFLSPHKTVVTAGEVEQIIKEMGPVEAAGNEPHGTGTGAPAADADRQHSQRTGPKRLYRIPEDGMWEGVCSGIAAYIGVDPVFVRILFLVLIVWSAGLGLIGYWILASIIPEASTPDERAAAHGQSPMNAQELIDQAKKHYANFTDGSQWNWQRRQERRAWRQQRRASRWHSRWGWGGSWGTPPAPPPDAYGLSMLAGLRAALLTVVFTLLLWFWGWTIFSLVTRGHVFGQTLPDNVPPWVEIVALVVLFQFVTWPLRFARRRAYYAPGAAHSYYGPFAALGSVMSLAFWVLAAWLAYHYIPEVREIIRSLPDVWNSFVQSINA